MYQPTWQNTNNITTQTQVGATIKRDFFFFFFCQGEVAFTSFQATEADQVSQVLPWNHKHTTRCGTHPSLSSSCYLRLCLHTYEMSYTSALFVCLFWGVALKPWHRATQTLQFPTASKHTKSSIVCIHISSILPAPPPFHTHIYKHSHTGR